MGRTLHRLDFREGEEVWAPKIFTVMAIGKYIEIFSYKGKWYIDYIPYPGRGRASSEMYFFEDQEISEDALIELMRGVETDRISQEYFQLTEWSDEGKQFLRSHGFSAWVKALEKMETHPMYRKNIPDIRGQKKLHKVEI